MKPKVNRRLFRRVIAAIKRGSPQSAPGHCGDPGCIAGYALALSGKKCARDGWDDDAAKVLRVTWMEANALFFVVAWPNKFRDRHVAAKTPRGRASAAVARIEHFLRTGE